MLDIRCLKENRGVKFMTNVSVEKLEKIAKQLRLDGMKMVYEAKDGHPGPAFSIADVVTTLYFEQMKINPQEPRGVRIGILG